MTRGKQGRCKFCTRTVRDRGVMAEKLMSIIIRTAAFLAVVFLSGEVDSLSASEPLVIAASPSMAAPLEALGRAFETNHPDVTVRIYFDSGLDLRRTIAGMENSPKGQYFIERGPIHLVAPGGDELITRLEQKYYVLPGTKRPYAEVPLTLVVPVTLVEAPSSFEELGKGARYRIAVADPTLTELGRQTGQLFTSLGIA